MTLLRADNLHLEFRLQHNALTALRGVSLTLANGWELSANRERENHCSPTRWLI